MNQCTSFLLITFGLSLMCNPLLGKENSNQNILSRNSPASPSINSSGCNPTTAKTDLDINNIRTKIMVSGDMWWDLSNARYEVPKGSGKNSMYAGALWIGGLDAGGNLKAAAMTYRQSGNDFWAGPINQSTVDVTPATCFQYDKQWKLTRNQVEQFVNGQLTTMPAAIQTWPGNGNPANNEAQFLAPFFDANGDGLYDHNAGDYPYYDFDGNVPCKSCGNPGYKDVLLGDQTIWWVFNDVGNTHGQTQGAAIGIEVQAQAFSFSTNDEINNMTFYKYKVINRSTSVLNQTFLGQWVDVDLGKYDDDFVGCDVSRGFGYGYNGDPDDDGGAGYGLNPPAIGIDFFEGPLADAFDGIDNNRNGIMDEACEEIIMSKFLYYYNNFSGGIGNPEQAQHYYNFMKGLWKDNTPMTYGGVGYNTGIPCDYMFPGDSDPIGWGVGGSPTSPNPQAAWSEVTEGNTPGDRRFIQSAGPFTMQPGAVNYMTTGVIWARAVSGGPLASVELLKVASDKAQALFDNCFKLIQGPPAPNLSIIGLDRELIISITNSNLTESFNKIDPTISTLYPDSLRRYKFQGYQIFQLLDANVTNEEIANRNPAKVKLAIQVDIKDGIAQLVNHNWNASLGANIPQMMVNGLDNGVLHTFSLKKDFFNPGTNNMVNGTQYYFAIEAYAHNNYKTYNPNDPFALDGQKRPYISNDTYTIHDGIPTFVNLTNSVFGTSPPIRRIEGQGNMKQVLDLTPGAITQILVGYPHFSPNPIYEPRFGPLDVRVYDPTSVIESDFEVRFDGVSDASRWTLKNLISGMIYQSDTTLSVNNEQLFPALGLAIKVGKVKEPGQSILDNNGFLEATRTYTDPSKNWLNGVADQDGLAIENWIRAGTSGQFPADYPGQDDGEVYEKVLGGTWGPYRILSKDKSGPKWPQSVDALSTLDRIPSVDVVFTSDQSKWTRSAIIEMSEDPLLSQASATRFNPRKAPSVDKNGVSDGTGNGMGWFPGYAINVSTGERLNIIFGENSALIGENGRDMIWNPTVNIRGTNGDTLLGGMHFTYIMATRYDSCAYFMSQLNLLTTAGKRNVYKEAMWVTLPILSPTQNLLATDAKVRLRVADNYAQFNTSSPAVNNDNPLYNFSTIGLSNPVSINNGFAVKNTLDDILVSPNPYHANYGVSRIKISNLPAKCVVSIYSINGILIKKLINSETSNSNMVLTQSNLTDPKYNLEWDLKNSGGSRIKTGIYVIHIDAYSKGQKAIKWICLTE